MCEFHIPLQAPRPPYDPTKPHVIVGEYKPPIQVFLNDKEMYELKLMYPQDPEFERQRNAKRESLLKQQIVLNIKNILKRANYIINHDKTNSKP